MKKLIDLRNNHTTQHVAFWGAYLLFTVFIATVRSSVVEEVTFHFGFEFTQTLFMVIAVYVNLRILIPLFLEKQRYWSYSILVILLLFVNAFLLVSFLNLFPDVKPHFINKPDPSPHWIVPVVFMEIMVVAISSALHFLRENFRLKEAALNHRTLESSKLKAELNSLKSQINPHFLFNSLNNIYSHSLLESKRTPELILKLSGLLNYIIYECQDELVPLEKELEFLTNYVDLEQIRIDESVQVNLNINVIDPMLRVAPLLFVPLIENAFKHGVNIAAEAPFIQVDLSMDEKHTLHFSCQNLKDAFPEAEKHCGGIGLENVRKRLELIYPGKHEFVIEENDDQYTVIVELELGETEE
jgi:two-component system, LytTR family, sensor kinase